MKEEIKRGDVVFAELSGCCGCEQYGKRPVLILQNDVGNTYSNTTIIATISSQLKRKDLPTHVMIGRSCGLLRDSVVMLEQIRTIDKSRIIKRLGKLNEKERAEVDSALKVSLCLNY